MDEPDVTLDALGLLCPLPVLKARKRLSTLMSGQVLRMVADDPAAIVDVPHFCTEAGHTLLDHRREGLTLTFDICKG
jgi:tRNA 2-thiouridine synthesizing protein A